MKTIGYMYAEDRELKLLRPLVFSEPQKEVPEGFAEVQLVRRDEAEATIERMQIALDEADTTIIQLRSLVLRQLRWQQHRDSVGCAMNDAERSWMKEAEEAVTHNAEVRGDAPLYGAASLSTDGLGAVPPAPTFGDSNGA